MDVRTRQSNLIDAEIRAIIEDTERQTLGGALGAIARAGLGTVAIVLAVFASTDSRTVGLILLSGVFIVGLAVYIRSVARSVATKPRIRARPAPSETVPPPAPPETSPVAAAPLETSPVAAAPPAIPAAPLGSITGGAWSRLSQKQRA